MAQDWKEYQQQLNLKLKMTTMHCLTFTKKKEDKSSIITFSLL